MKILYQDAAMVAVDKPSGLLAVPGRGHAMQDCAVSRLRRVFPDMIEQPAVHRLDMATSGVMVLARTRAAHRILSHQFAVRKTEKHYIALLDGDPCSPGGFIRLRFRLDPDNRPCQVHDPSRGKLGITLWFRIGAEGCATRVLFIPLTGRTHQLRVHAAHPLGLGCPIHGDSLYGRAKQNEPMLLHAAALGIMHPITGIPMTIRAPVPF